MSQRTNLGALFLAFVRTFNQAKARAFSTLSRGAFASFGAGSVIEPPVRIYTPGRIVIGEGVFVGADSWIQVLQIDTNEEPALWLGDGTSISGGCVISAAQSVRIGRAVLMARNVYISDHNHAFGDTSRPVQEQGISKPEPVEICDGSWLGENVVVNPGVRIGRGAVIGANAVVLDDVPDHSVAVGVPARVVRSFASTDAADVHKS